MRVQPDGSVASTTINGPRKKHLSVRSNDSDEEDDIQAALQELKQASSATLLKTAAEVVKDLTSRSNVFDLISEDKIPQFGPEEVTKGPVLGRGGFCVVQDIDKIKAARKGGRTRTHTEGRDDKEYNGSILARLFSCGKSATEDDLDDISVGSFRSMNSAMSLATRQSGPLTRNYVISKQRKARRKKLRNGHGCYVVKSVSRNMDKITYMKAHVDLAVEAKFLSALDHHNIIGIVGVSSTGPCTKDYFLILDRLNLTLGGKIKEWEDRQRLSSGLTGCLMGGARKQQDLYRERIEASYDVANALYFLHSKKIVYRDLKPQNIGFDSQETLKLFDFGLARELHDDDLQPNGTYRNLTSMTGAIRYMAPEVAAGKDYNLSADVYSWAMLMYYILALEPPFGLFTESMILRRAYKGYRPAIFERWNQSIKETLVAAWDGDLKVRPSFLEVSLVLRNELRDCDEQGSGKRSEAGTTQTSSMPDLDDTPDALCKDVTDVNVIQ